MDINVIPLAGTPVARCSWRLGGSIVVSGAGEAAGVPEDEEAAGDHGGGSDQGVQASGGGEGQGDPVVEEGPDQVSPDGPTDSSGVLYDPQDLSEIRVEDVDVRRLSREIGACSERDPHVGRRQRRCVVDPISHHRDGPPGPAAFPNLMDLVLRQEPRLYLQVRGQVREQ